MSYELKQMARKAWRVFTEPNQKALHCKCECHTTEFVPCEKCCREDY